MITTQRPRRKDRVELSFAGPPARVFPLLCPVREYEWIDGWACTMVYSESGVAERGGIFQTSFPDVGDETWVISRYEPERAIAFVRVAPNVMVTEMEIELSPAGERTRATLTYTRTALTQAGALLLEAATGEVLAEEGHALEAMANHFLATGARLPRPKTARRLH